MGLPFSAATVEEDLLRRIERREVSVGIVGLGYVGLALAQAVVAAGFCAVGFDVDTARVQSLLLRARVEGPQAWMQAAFAAQRFKLSSAASELAAVEIVLVCVQTPLDAEQHPDLAPLCSALKSVAEHATQPLLLCLESTTYPTTTRQVAVPLLERCGRSVGENIFVAYSPERVDPGNRDWPLERIPKLVGAIDAAAQRLACGFYAQVFERVVAVSTPEVAEASKLLENTFRAVNIALVNEMKQVCDRLGVNVWEVLDAASTKPFGFFPFSPGPGVGGHCIPIDPQYLRWISNRHGLELPLVATALAVNASMADHLITRIESELSKRGSSARGSRIAVLGVAYKPDIDDVRESPALRVMARLHQAGAEVTYHDPLVPSVSLSGGPEVLQSAALDAAYLAAQDCVLIITAHSSFDAEFIVRHAKLVFDTRNVTRRVAEGRERIVLS